MSLHSKLKDYVNQVTQDDILNNINCDYCTTTEFNDKFINSNINNIHVSIIHANIRSLNANHQKLLQLLNELKLAFKIIILTEVWTSNIQFYHNILPGYNFIYDLPLNSIVGGVAMFIQKDISFNIRDDLKIPCNNYKIENIFIEFKLNSASYVIGGIYRHPNYAIVPFQTDVDNIMQKLSLSNRKTCCAFFGDVNLDLLKVGTHKETTNYVDMLISNRFMPLTLLPTRITDSSATAIDHVYLKSDSSINDNYKIHSGNLTFDLSDHLVNKLGI